MIDVLDELADGALEAHTSIVLAYNVELIFYDRLIRRRLVTSGASNQIVFCDATAYAIALDAVDAQSRIGRAYSVTPVRVAGAFHPKAYLLLGRQRGRLVLGSGNASIGGLVRNAEVFGRFEFDVERGEPPHAAFALVVDLARRLAERATPAVRAQLDRAQAWSPWLADRRASPDLRAVHLGGAGGPPLAASIARAIEGARIRRVVAVSPSFDRKLAAVADLAGLAGGTHETVIVVRPERVTIDGARVASLPAKVRWTQFVDPRHTQRKEPPDSFPHAKLYLVETDAADHLFFGSANLSAPAMSNGSNVELLVELPRAPPGTWLDELGLAPSLENDVRDELVGRRWESEPEEPGFAAHLAGVEWSPVEGWLVALGIAPPGEFALALALGRTIERSDQVLALRLREDGLAVASAAIAFESVRYGWLVDAGGDRVSGAVALTWPDVARARLGGWFGHGAAQALFAMKGGDVLGPVLFEFLDRIPDMDVLAIKALSHATGGGGGRKDGLEDGPRPIESFYTSSTAAASESVRLALGDRTDLDLLAALVQPLAANPGAAADEDEDEDEDEGDDVLAEEVERQLLDHKRASGDGSERVASARVPSAARMRIAGRRLERRVDRAAVNLAQTLAAIKPATRMTAGDLARQVWMTFIAAFVAGREVETSDAGEQVVVEPEVLAHYVLRCAAVFAGDGRQGLLASIEPGAWATRDGATLAEGLRFLVAACAWATAWFEETYARAQSAIDPDDRPVALGCHDAIPLFVFARLLDAVSDTVGVPNLDEDDVRKRLSAWDLVERGAPGRVLERAQRLAGWLRQVEREPPQPQSLAGVVPGRAIVLPTVGAAIVVAVEGSKIWVATLGRPGRPLRSVVPYKLATASVPPPPDVGNLLLVPLTRGMLS